MTRKELIEIICNDTSEVTCKGNCDLPEQEGNTGECCRKCAEVLLDNYENEIYNQAMDDMVAWYKNNYEGMKQIEQGKEPWVYVKAIISKAERLKKAGRKNEV